ncbi:protein kinase [Nocardia vinacea]|uniref:Serine/threonine-protein kinase PknK n=1 Tax=Nocardia vinacea TaxID=96468 RepID=A0ABZ1YLH7_9NOCA|nr:protein kinase [Nocardia vinacea]
MVDRDGESTQRDLAIGIAAELAAAGFDDAHEIGRGGFGVVYRCVEHALERLVAVKVLNTESGDDERARFLREQRALGRFSNHPHIVQVLSADITDTGRPYLVMPFYALGSLQARIRDQGLLPWQEVLSIAIKIAGALAAAHAHGIVHRDVNPANILLSDYGEPQLSDFGIARITGAFETAAGLITGTPAFTAPEVLRGAEPTEAADIYGLGTTMFCLLTGHAAFERRAGESMVAQFVRITSEPVPDLRRADVPAPLGSALESAMAQDPSGRPGSAREFGERLRNIQFSYGLTVDSMALPADSGTRRAQTIVPLISRPAQDAGLTIAPTPSTMYRPPSSPRQPIRRGRLLDSLREGQARRLVLIHGPAGFGKSTLAAEWVDILAAEGIRVAWLTVDHDDDNLVWFLSHVIEAIRYAHPGVAADLSRLLEEHVGDAVRYVMTTLIDEIHDSGEIVALVIDDWHRVTSPASVAAMEFLLDHGCHHLRLIVTSRSRTGLPLGRMRVRDELIEIDASALRFDDEETTAFLADMNELTLSTAEVERLRESTEGWAAALQLASMSLRGRDDPGAYIDQISGRHYAIGEYLMENVVDALEPNQLEFVMRTSVPERINSELAEALTGVSHGQDMLEQVRQRDLFLRSMDDSLRWFRYHGLFADFLRDRLIRLHPGLLEELHLTASRWFAAHDMLTEAVDHALAAGAAQLACDVVADHAEELLEQSRTATFLGLAGKLPSSFTTSNLRLQVQLAWANVSVQRPGAATAALDRANAALAAVPHDDDVSAGLRFEVKLARVATALVTDQSTVFDPELAQGRDSLRPFLAHSLAVVAMVSALYRFDFAEVRQWHRWIEPFRDRTRGPFGVMYCDCCAGIAANELLDIGAAESDFRTALRQASQTGGQSQATRLAGALLGELLYEKGQFIEAEELLAAGLGLEGGAVEFQTASYGTGARLAAVRGDPETMHERLDEGAKVATNLGLPRLAARIVNERVRLGLPITEADRRDLEQLEPYSAHFDHSSAVTAELSHDSAIRLLLAEGTEASAEQARRRAERLVHVIATQDRPRALLTAELLYGCCLSAVGRTAQAAKHLEPTLRRCAEHGLVRLVVDSGRQLQPAIETIYGATTSEHQPERPFLRQVLAEFEQALPKRI